MKSHEPRIGQDSKKHVPKGTFLIKSIKKLKHSESDAGRTPNGNVLNQIY